MEKRNYRFQDLTGQTINQLKAIEYVGYWKGSSRWKWLCTCGDTFTAAANMVKSGNTKSCGCLRVQKWQERYALVGKSFGQLTVIRQLSERSNARGVFWECECTCGNTIKATTHSLVSTHPDVFITHCGCKRKKGKLPFGEAAFNQVVHQYKRNAGKRKIAWDLTKVEAALLFKADCYYCGQCPATELKAIRFNGGYTYNGIDRIDSSKGYTKDNVVSCCNTCNVAKMAMSQESFILLANAIAAQHPRPMAEQRAA